MEEKIKQLEENPSLRSISGVINIPVVVHVVYHDDEENISAELIQAQIDALNQDFRRLNTDADDIWPQAVDTEIEFALAQYDPCGFPTTGITRTYNATDISVVEGQGQDYISNSDVGGKDGWSSGSYLNFWIADIPQGLSGFAQYPVYNFPDRPTNGI
ncbi:hypothetical protein WNY78_15315 [Psychroserpens sp. AS72]|uniref:hypothetical protein n=1 Tax=Psychroserpens sp. AS72 TaxID=3135775 RepID=UPI0031720828